MNQEQNSSAATAEAQTDFRFSNHGSLILWHPQTDAARAWLDEHCRGAENQYWGGALVVEPRYHDNLVELGINDGLTL